MSKQYWNRTYEYQRILEILEDYWLTEADEDVVVVELHFKKADGQTQHKQIVWLNPNIPRKYGTEIKDISAKELLEMELPDPDEIFKDFE